MNKEKVKNIVYVGVVLILLVAVIGITYAYFKLQIEGSGKDIVVNTGDLRLKYTDGDELTLDNAFPGDSVTKKITVENIGGKGVTYSLNWTDLINTISDYELHLTMECKSYKNYGTNTQEEYGTCDRIYRSILSEDTIMRDEDYDIRPESSTYNPDKYVPVPMDYQIVDGDIYSVIKNNISIDMGITHEYTVTVSFDNKNYLQNYNKKKTFSGKIDIKEYTAPKPVSCTYDGELKQGAEFVNGIYTYRYMQNNVFDKTEYDPVWTNMDSEGWSVILTNPDSTDAVTEAPCTIINDKPVISMSYMFNRSNASSIDVSNFDTSNIIDMSGMFRFSEAIRIYGLDRLNTSNVTNMYQMFEFAEVTVLNLSEFDTRNVTNMAYMFDDTYSAIINICGFDTSNVTDMNSMFDSLARVRSLDLNSFDTSKVTDMSWMFSGNKIYSLDLSSFDTSKVTNMYGMFNSFTNSFLDIKSLNTSNVTDMTQMFSGINVDSLDLSNFDTSKVTTMKYMFSSSKIDKLDVSNFNTCNVTDMSRMFYGSTATEIKGLNNFDTSNVTDMSNMFYGTKVEILDLSSFDTSNVTKMSWMFGSADTIEIKGLEKFDTSNVTDMQYMFYKSKLSQLNLDNFDTSNVTNMQGMFSEASATSYSLSNFNTSNVTNMRNMFEECKASVLDLSSFDMSNVTNVRSMFSNALTTTGYAKDTAAAKKFNNSSNMPSSLTFTVKS